MCVMVSYNFRISVLLLVAQKVCLVRFNEKVHCDVRAVIDSGVICGAHRLADDGTEYASFRGIPYAKQPVGPLRFQELQPVAPWKHYLDTTEERAICPQHDELYGSLVRPLQGMSEACIYANVHIPLEARQEPAHNLDSLQDHEEGKLGINTGLPILVYIHGGGFQAGSGDADLNGPEYLVSQGVIVITFNYRLDVFGFLYLNSTKVPGNQGLRDQVTLLRWVQRNAWAFGGDPDNVTLMGQSAGSTCAHLLSLSKETEGLFRRLILISGTANPGFYTTSPLYSQSIAAMFLSKLGINSTDPDSIHEQLINMSLERILIANSAVQYITGLVSFSPVVETRFPGVTRVIDDEPTELIKRGRGRHYPLIVGSTTVECETFRPRLIYLDMLGRIEANPLLILNPKIVFETLPDVSLQLARRKMRRYFKKRPTYDRFLKSCTETFFQYPAFQLATLRASMEGAPVYLYRFSFNSSLNVIKESGQLQYRGSAHIEDLVLVLRPNAFLSKRDVLPSRYELMVDWMRKFVVNFMRCSNPSCVGAESTSPWPAVHEEVLNYQRVEQPQVYSNRGPTPYEWDMIRFYERLHADSRRAVVKQGLLTNGTPEAAALLGNMTAMANIERPKYPIIIAYKYNNKIQ